MRRLAGRTHERRSRWLALLIVRRALLQPQQTTAAGALQRPTEEQALLVSECGGRAAGAGSEARRFKWFRAKAIGYRFQCGLQYVLLPLVHDRASPVAMETPF